MKKRIVSLALALALLIGMMPMVTIEAEAVYTWISDRNAVDGSDYTTSTALAAKLNSIFDGNASVYSNSGCTNLVNTKIGTSNVKNDGVTKYVGPYGGAALNSGTSCWIYANGVYYTLFGECTGNGAAGTNSEKLDLSGTSSKTATYANFQDWGVRQGVGALIRANGHSMIVLSYDADTLTILDGNGNSDGLVSIRVRSWDQISFTVSYIIQPKESYYNSLYPSCNHSDYYKDCGVCSACGYVFDWESTFSAAAMGTYTITKAGTPRTDKPYDAATKASYELVVGQKVTVLGSYTNAYGSTWYKFTDVSGEIAYIYEDYLSFADYLELEVTCSGFSPADASVLPPETYPVQGTVTSNYPLKSIDAYLNGEYYASWTASNQTTTSVSLRSTDINYKLDFSSLSDGGYIITLMAKDFANPTSIKFFSSTFDIQSESSDICTHSYTSSVTAPTYTSRGYTTYTCTKCGYSYKSDYTDVLVQEFRVTFDPTGGILPSAVATNTLDGINVDRGAGYLVVYNNGGEIADTNKYGIEVQVDSNGKVIGKRDYLSETKMTIPVGGFILSGQAKQGTWVGEINLGYYVAYDEALMEVYVYDTHEAYEAHHKKVAESEEIGLLPVPTREGYTFNGWYTATEGGHKITEEDFIGSDLTFYAHWISNTCSDGHTYFGTAEIHPTMYSDGSLYCCCTQCGLSFNVVMPAFNTVDYEYDVIIEPTCIQPGLGVYGWLNYDYGIFTFDVDIDPLGDDGHVYTETVVAPTCTASGYTSYTCSVCGDSYTDTPTPAIGHAYTSRVMLQPTETDTGILTVQCGNCSEDISITLPVLSYLDYNFTLLQKPAVGQVGIGRYTWIETAYGEISIDVEYPALIATTLTITEANELGVAQGAGNYTAESYYVTGVVTRVRNAMYGNIYIADEDGNELYIYGMSDADGNRYDVMDPCPIPGDTITVCGTVGSYDGTTAQMYKVTLVDYTPGTTESTDPEPDSTLFLPDAVLLGESKPDNVYTAGSYYVTGIVTSVGNATYGNIDITDIDGWGYSIHLYTVYDSTGTVRYDQMTDQPAVGDLITVYGRIGNHNGTAQILNANVVERTAAADLAIVHYASSFGHSCPQYMTKGVPTELELLVFYRSGYNFLGWGLSPDAAEAIYYPGDIVTLTEDMYLYAVWEQAPVLSAPEQSVTVYVENQYGYAGAATQYQLNCTESGSYLFRGMEGSGGCDNWIALYDADGNSLGYDNDSGSDQQFRLEYCLTAGETYYVSVGGMDGDAKPFNFSISHGAQITYDANGGEGAPESHWVYYGDAPTISDVIPTREDSEFLGWATSADAAEPEFQPGDTYTANANVTLYAVWEQEETVLYGDVNSDGKVNTKDRMDLTRYLAGMTGYTEDMIDLTAADVNRDGKVNTQDRMILTRYLAQWTAYPELPHLS